MPLPELIEIVPLTQPVQAEVTVPGSKSITNRALVLAALAQSETTLQGALWSEDTQVMVDCLQKLGFAVRVEPDPNEFCNRSIIVQGLGGKIPQSGTKEKPLELFVGNAGTAARFLSALVCLGQGVYRLHGVPRMHERPKAALFQALRELGYGVESANHKLPVIIHGKGPRPGSCVVDIGESSQFASALMLCAGVGGWQVKVAGENAEESPYVEMTRQLIKAFPARGGTFQIEPDASGGSYFWAAGALTAWMFQIGRLITVAHWPSSGWQIDSRFRDYSKPAAPFKAVTSRQTELGDSIMTAIILAPLEPENRPGPKRFTQLGRLRVQECDRVLALHDELGKCGAKIKMDARGETLEIFPSVLHGAEIETYNDHRMAMCFAILGLKVAGIKIKNPACVKKTFPNFFQKLSAPPPAGLGVTIRDAATGKILSGSDLFAE